MLGWLDTHPSSQALASEPVEQTGLSDASVCLLRKRPNVEAYATCSDIGQPRCVKCDLGVKKLANSEEDYLRMECRFLDFDGKRLTYECHLDMMRG